LKTFPELLICFLSFSLTVFSQNLNNNKFHPFSNSFGFTLEVGGTIPRTDYKIDELSITSRLLIEYFLSSKSAHAFGIRILGGAGILRAQVFSNDFVYPPIPDNINTDFYFFGGGFNYALNIGSSVPYFSVSASYTSFNPLDENGYQLPNNRYSIYENGAMLYSIEAGIRFPFSERWSLNLGTNLNFSNTDYLDDIKAGNNNDAFISFFTGLSYYLGKEIDTDNDGVEDDFDLCPDTPEGVKVDEFGCNINELKSQALNYNTLKDHFISNGIFTDDSLYCFQVNVYTEMKKAKDLQNEIAKFGFIPDILEIKVGNLVWYSIRIGYFNSFEKAKVYRDDFFKRTNLKLN
jgi:hypothetical protein